MAAPNYDELDPGIREVVRFLNEAGFTTTDSGDGVSKTDPDGCHLDIANVHLIVSTAEAVAESHKVSDLFEGCGVMFSPAHPDAPEPSIQLTYNPHDGVAIVSVYGLDDSLLAKAVSQSRAILRDWAKKDLSTFTTPEERDHIDAEGSGSPT